MSDSRGSPRGDVCNYLHQSSKKGINIKSNKNYDDTKSETQNKRGKQEVVIEKPDDIFLSSRKQSLLKRKISKHINLAQKMKA